ncbi:hypothetical protein FisN_22Lu174 [Fistulifera solaris]|uniref:Uncharacterized protein n=1 Tax=Fistulifera solaris TaxID=1519565 RepID=A0A1Z5JBT5_FISSO|nr:hypothetical protein FisN_22Lu174 [Fistulifera solaris]|eukprot:GAX11470.1 hypothetical protein FisN_22Lu174 [Fistulifera solaris]
MNEDGDAADAQRREARRRAQRNELLAAIRPARRSWQRLLDLQDNTSTESTRDGTTSSNTDVADGEEEEEQSRTWTQSMRWLLHRGDHEADDHPMHQRIMDLRALAIQNRMIRLDNGNHAREINSQAANATTVTTTNATNGELSPLMTAAAMGDIDQLTELLQTHTSWSRIKGGRGQTPLHEASKNGHVEAVRLLIELCSGIELVRDNDRLSPLHYAADNGHLDIVSLLLSCGIEVNTKSRFQTTALHVASRNGHLGVVEVLIVHAWGGSRR